MTTSHDSEIAAWRAEWISNAEADAAPGGLRQKAVRQQRSLRLRHVLDLVAVVFFLAFSAWIARKNPSVEAYIWALVVWVSTIVAAAFSLWNWQILWIADLKSVAEFTTDYRNRCLAGLRAVRFGLWFLAIQIAISGPWLTLNYFRHRITTGEFAVSILFLAAFTAGFVAWFRHHRRVATRELDDLAATQAEPQD